MKHTSIARSLNPLLVAMGLVCGLAVNPVLAESRINIDNDAYFQDEDFLKLQAHEVDNLAYGEALYAKYTEQDLSALVRLEQEAITDTALDVYSLLLQASIASDQSMTNQASSSLEQALQEYGPSYDSDRLAQYLASLNYQEGNYKRASDILASITAPEKLADPDAYYYLQAQVAIAQDDLLRVQDQLSLLQLSPWRMYTLVNLGLGRFRAGEFENGIADLTASLEVYAELKAMDHEEFWYERGYQHMPQISAQEYQEQLDELKPLAEKAQMMIGFGHIQQIRQSQQQQGSEQQSDQEPANQAQSAASTSEQLEAAKQALFALPQKSPFAAQGLEMLAQMLSSLAMQPQTETKKSLFGANKDAPAPDYAAQARELYQQLTGPSLPLLTQLRSHFALIEMSEQPGEKQAQLDQSLAAMDKALAQRKQLLAEPTSFFTGLLAPLYRLPSDDQQTNEFEFDLQSYQDQPLPIHQQALTDWLAQEQTRSYIKTLRFFKQGQAFSERWQRIKPVLLANSAQEERLQQMRESAQVFAEPLALQRTLEQQVQQRQQQLTQVPALALLPADAANWLSDAKQTASQLQGVQADWASFASNRLERQIGQVLWDGMTHSNQRRLLGEDQFKSMQQLLQENTKLVRNIQTKLKTTKTSDHRGRITALDQKIQEMTTRIEQALASNEQLFVDSFKALLQDDQKHIIAASLALRLRQAELLDAEGAQND